MIDILLTSSIKGKRLRQDEIYELSCFGGGFPATHRTGERLAEYEKREGESSMATGGVREE